jgi:hypothetical protein
MKSQLLPSFLVPTVFYPGKKQLFLYSSYGLDVPLCYSWVATLLTPLHFPMLREHAHWLLLCTPTNVPLYEK